MQTSSLWLVVQSCLGKISVIFTLLPDSMHPSFCVDSGKHVQARVQCALYEDLMHGPWGWSCHCPFPWGRATIQAVSFSGSGYEVAATCWPFAQERALFAEVLVRMQWNDVKCMGCRMVQNAWCRLHHNEFHRDVKLRPGSMSSEVWQRTPKSKRSCALPWWPELCWSSGAPIVSSQLDYFIFFTNFIAWLQFDYAWLLELIVLLILLGWNSHFVSRSNLVKSRTLNVLLSRRTGSFASPARWMAS